MAQAKDSLKTIEPLQCHLWTKERLTPEDLDFETIEKFVESSHLDHSILKCRQCGQLYFYEFYEVVDFFGGEDDMYTTYIPVKEYSSDQLKIISPMDILAYTPRLQWDNKKIVWIRR